MRILLLEDHPIVRSGCRRLLDVLDGVEIEEAATADDGLRIARAFMPDIVVLDLRLPDSNGLGLLTTFLSHEPAPKVIVFSMYDEPAFAARALEAGAQGYVTKNDDPQAILQAVEKVSNGGVFLTPSMAERLALTVAATTSEALHALSVRELDALELLGEGKTLGEIADQLKVSYRTSASLVAQIKSKLNMASSAALIKWAVEHRGLRSRTNQA